MQTLIFRGLDGPIYDPLAGDACDGAGHGTAGLHSRREPRKGISWEVWETPMI
jgi:hypothetical protein